MASAVGVLWVTFLAIFCPFCVAEYGKRNLTLFHVNPIRYTGISNMNLADVQGDAFFTMRSIGLPKLCRNKSEDWHVCDNPEAAGNDRVITKAIVEVENKFDPYSTCNICVNGSAPSSNPPAPCTIGEYVCTCYVKGTDLRKICNETLVGREDVNSSHGHIIPGFPSFFTWQANLAYRLGGFWYSTTSAGKDRSWRLAEESRRVNASCLGDLIMKKIRNRLPECFMGCPQPMNTTSDCSIECSFEALIGSKGGEIVPAPASDGLSGTEMVGMWLEAFQECPSIPFDDDP